MQPAPQEAPSRSGIAMAVEDDVAAPELETGYHSSTPPGDSLFLDVVRDLAVSYRLHAELAGGRAMVDDALGVALADNGSPALYLNPVVLLRPLGDHEAEAFAQRCASFYGSRSGGGFAVWSLWPTPDLRPFGFQLGGHPPFMLREAGGRAPGIPDGLRIEQVIDDTTAFDFETAMVDGFPVAELQPAQPGAYLDGESRSTPGWHHFVGYIDGRPVASSSAYVGERVLRVDNVATLASQRGRGIGAAITFAATFAAATLPATLFASDDGRPVYERMGYRALSRATFWIGSR
jgi:hypothetical protein